MLLYMNKELSPIFPSLTSFPGSNCSEEILVSFALGFSIIASLWNVPKIPMQQEKKQIHKHILRKTNHTRCNSYIQVKINYGEKLYPYYIHTYMHIKSQRIWSTRCRVMAPLQ